MPDTPTVGRNEAASQFEIRTDAGAALLKYRMKGNAIELVHTEVPAALESHGYGSALATAALEYARANHLRVVPSCSFVRGFMERHHEYDDLRVPP